MTRKIANLRWWITGLVFLSTVINYIDRQTLSVLAPILTKELNLSNAGYGLISMAFMIPYTAMYIVAGLLIDRYGSRLIYGVAVVWWSIASMLHAATSTVLGFGTVRFLLGTAESANFVAAQKVAAEWFPPRDRGTLNGWVQAGTTTGAVIAPPLVVWLALNHGWRFAFILTGAAGLIWAVVWFWFYRLPEEHPRITDEELALLGLARQSKVVAARPAGLRTLLHFFRYPQTWGLLLARIISDPVWWFYLFWLPKFITEKQGMTTAGMSYVVWIPYLFSDIGSIAGGWYSGRLIARGAGTVAARRWVMLLSAAVMPVGLLLLLEPGIPMTLFLISLVLGAHSVWKTNLVTLTVDIFPRHVVATVHGIVATGGGIGGSLFTGFAGIVIDKYSYTPLLAMMGILHPIAYLVVRQLVRGEVSLLTSTTDVAPESQK